MDSYRFQIPIDESSQIYKKFYSQSTVQFISQQITLRLAGVHPEGKNIIVPNKTIFSVMDSIFNGGNSYHDVDVCIMQVISFIVETIKSEFQIEKNNRSLNVWDATLRLENLNMQRHPEQVRVREKALRGSYEPI